jgi:GTP cyclohydrolase I
MSKELEIANIGMANGIADADPLTELEKVDMIMRAEKAFGEFLDALKCDWRNDPNSNNTPKRVAKAYVRDIMDLHLLLDFQVMDMMVWFLKVGYL